MKPSWYHIQDWGGRLQGHLQPGEGRVGPGALGRDAQVEVKKTPFVLPNVFGIYSSVKTVKYAHRMMIYNT